MKKFLLTGAALAVLAAATPAFAADMARRPIYKAPPAAPLFNWTGFYVGGHVGYGWGDAGGLDTDGWFGGGQIGVNYQFAPNWVWGVEADLSGSGIDGGNAATSRFKTDMFGTVRARLGYTVDRVMFYGTGGLAWADSKATLVGVSDSQTNVGWAAGAGIEYAFAPNWTAKIEYMHADYGSDDYHILPTTSIDYKTDTVKVGVNYLFNSGGRW
jgi:outer membrane immunogenic protein